MRKVKVFFLLAFTLYGCNKTAETSADVANGGAVDGSVSLSGDATGMDAVVAADAPSAVTP
jgi:hypothetical protein